MPCIKLVFGGCCYHKDEVSKLLYKSMASRTAEGFYKTLINGADYLSDYFVHIGENDLLDLVKV